jgi:ABC-type nitrate/sulfonate/bicarbonate transport system substrate-binding protein
MKIAVPDLISPSYFPALAAVELGFFAKQGLDVTHDLRAPANRTYEDMAHGDIDFAACEAHAALAAFPDWQGVKLLCAQGQGMYWFLVMRTDIGAVRNDLSCVRGRRIGAAPWVELGLKRMLMAVGIDPATDCQIAPIPGGLDLKVNTGVKAAEALESGAIDGFWANGMGAEVAVRRGVGTVIIDARRGDGPPGCFDYTAAVIATTDKLIAEHPKAAAGAIKAIMATQAALKADLSLATRIGRKLFPPMQAELIAELIRRDLPFYDPALSRPFIASLGQFCQDMGVQSRPVPYEQIVATPFADLWTAA